MNVCLQDHSVFVHDCPSFSHYLTVVSQLLSFKSTLYCDCKGAPLQMEVPFRLLGSAPQWHLSTWSWGQGLESTEGCLLFLDTWN